MEHLASPPAARDLHVSASPTAPASTAEEEHNTSNTSSEWHLSLASDDMPSLQWGDGSSGSIHLSPPSSRSPPARSQNEDNSAVRLINTSLDSPPQPLRRSSSTSSRDNPNRASLSRSQGPPTNVQFSPLSLAPSPLIGFPPLPPPVPSLLMALDQESPSSRAGGALGVGAGAGGKTILKIPRTPGTGQTVRFSASTVSPRRLAEEESPSAVAVEAQPSNTEQDSPSSFDEENSSLTHSTSFNDTSLGVGANSSNHVASFLSKLQAAIPSPDVSLLSPPPPPDASLSTITETPSLSLTSPSGGLKGLGLAMQQLAQGQGQGQRELWDESNPFSMGAGGGEISEMRSLEVTREGEGWGGGLSEVMEESEGAIGVEEMHLVIDGEGAQLPQQHEEQDEGNDSILDHFPYPATSAPTPRPSSTLTFGSPAPTPLAHQHRQQHLDSSSRTILPSPSPPPSLSPNEPTNQAEQEKPEDDDEPLDSFRTSRTSRPSPISSPAPAPTTPSRLTSPPDLPLPLAPITPSRSTSNATSSPSHANAITTTTSATKRGASSAFYRQFLQKRARESSVAADELGRLMRSSGSGAGEESMMVEGGEMSVYGTPGEGVSRIEQREEQEEQEEPSIYFSPTPADRRAGGQSRSLGGFEELEEEEMYEMEQSFDVEELRPSMLDEMPRQEDGEERYDELEEEERGKWLSPIAEAVSAFFVLRPSESSPQLTSVPLSSLGHKQSEPNTTINTLSPWTNSPSTDPRHPPPLQPSFSSFRPPIPPSPAPTPAPPTPSSQKTTMTLYHSTPDSRIPRLAQRRPAPSPSLTLNPFSLPASSSTTAAGTDLHLIQSLLSAQSDLNSNSSTQKFLLASLVTNLRNEVEGKEAVIRNLKEQVEEGRRGWREAVRELEEMEGARLLSTTSVGEEGEERIKIEALEEVVERLTEELEKRVASERELRRGREEEVEQLRRELGRAKVEVRDGEIRLRHARIGLSEAEEAAAKAREGERVALEEKERVVKEKDEARRKGREEALERERVVAMLREEVAVLQHQQNGEGSRDEEVERRVEVVKEESRLEIGIVKEQLAEVEATVIHLRSENQALQSSHASFEYSSTQHRQQLEHSLLDAQSSLSRTTAELASLQQFKAAVDEELDSTQQRLELVEKELDRLSDEMTLKDDKLTLQTSAWEEHQVGMARLMESVGTMEEEAQAKARELSELKAQMDEARREAEKLVEDRDRRLTESETQLSARIKKNEALVDECNRLKETVATLRKGSADREGALRSFHTLMITPDSFHPPQSSTPSSRRSRRSKTTISLGSILL